MTSHCHSQDTWEPPRGRYNEDEDEEQEDEEDDDDDAAEEVEDEVDRDVGDDERETAGNSWDKNMEEGNEVNGADGLQDLQYFPNFYHLLRSLDSGKNNNRPLVHIIQIISSQTALIIISIVYLLP